MNRMIFSAKVVYIFSCLVLFLFTYQPLFGIDDQASDKVASVLLESLNARSSSAYLQTGNNELRLKSIDRQKYVFQKIKDGIPVLGNEVRVFVDENANILRIQDESTENLALARRPENEITEMQAVAAAEDSSQNLRSLGSSCELAWFRIQDSARLVWQVTTRIEPNGQPGCPTDLITTIDAATSKVLSQFQRDTNIYRADPDTGVGVLPRIVINDTAGPELARSLGSNFPAVCFLDVCTGILVAPDVVITARHCGIAVGGFVSFGTDFNNPTFATTVQASILPAGSGSLLDGGDVAILRLNNPVPGNIATPMRFVDESTNLIGMESFLVGYGFNGVGSQGHGFSADGNRWAGQNVIDAYGTPATSFGENIFSTDFDDFTDAANTIPGSSSSALFNEATTAPGDSGGPLVVNVAGEDLIAGVLSGGTTDTSVFGDISWWTGTAIFRAEIEAEGGVFAEGLINDAAGNALAINSETPFVVTGTNVGATTEVNETNLENTTSTVWWTFVASETTTLEIDTTGSNFDAVVHIFQGLFQGVPASDLVLIADNDQPDSDPNVLRFQVFEGQKYGIRVGGRLPGIAEGDILLNARLVPPPLNDDFVASFNIPSFFPFTTDGNNFNATTELGEQQLDITEATVWWFVLAPENGIIAVDTFGSDFDTILHIYEGFFTGATPADLIPVVDNDQAAGTNQSQVSFPAEEGRFYEIRVGGVFASRGEIVLNVDFTPNTLLLGDVNLDGMIDLLDVAPFVELVSSGTFQIEADFNEDGLVNLLDVAPFIAALSGG